jgi:signal transduction histidine kinase
MASNVSSSTFPDLEDAAMRRGLRALMAGKTDRFTHAHVVDTPIGPRPQLWEISPLRVADATHFVAIPEGLVDAAAATAAVVAAVREAAVRPPRLDHHYDVTTAVDEQRRVRVSPIRLGRRTHLFALPDDVARTTDSPAPELLLFAQEEERHRIAIELHDSTSQHLVAVTLSLARLRRSVRATRGERRIMESMSRDLQDTIREIRTVSYLMNPPQLERDGLRTTVMRFLAGFEARAGLTTSATVSGVPDASSIAVQHALFRVLQEVLSDIYRRRKATRVDVVLGGREGWTTLTITDNGRDGSAEADLLTRTPVGVGVAGMHSPIAQLGGSLKVRHGADSNQVIVRLPTGVNKPQRAPGRRPAPRRRQVRRGLGDA